MSDFLTLQKTIESELQTVLADSDNVAVKSANYCLLIGGKRLRPVLMLSVAEMLAVEQAAVMPFALALEMIHTFSLIHDDLPAIDNDDLRRGNPTSHIVFGEAQAILGGDLLHNFAFEYITGALMSKPFTDDNRLLFAGVEALAYLARKSGSEGMIVGESLDVSTEGVKNSQELLDEIQIYKTGALLEVALCLPLILAGIEDHRAELLKKYAGVIGRAFQIKDDILDETADIEVLGKSIGKDKRDNKFTYVTLLGLDGAKRALADLKQQADKYLSELELAGLDCHNLFELNEFLYLRNY